MSEPGPEILDRPFFSLEYDSSSAAFIRKIPPKARDLGGGLFRFEGKIHKLPEGRDKELLAREFLEGKELLSLVRRGYNPLIQQGPVLAEREDRLMEMVMSDPETLKQHSQGSGEILVIYLREKIARENWLPLRGLPDFKLYNNRIYEVIPDDRAALLFQKGKPRQRDFDSMELRSPLILRGEEIPAFADSQARLIYVFAESRLYSFLSQEELFVKPGEISLSLRLVPHIQNGAGRAFAIPTLNYQGKFYSPGKLSGKFRQTYMKLGKKWIRRETLEQCGIGPLNRYINGESLAPYRIKTKDLLLREEKNIPGLWQNMDEDRLSWIQRGDEGKIFHSHLEFLRTWGLSGGLVLKEKEKTAIYLAAWLLELGKILEADHKLENQQPRRQGRGIKSLNTNKKGRVLVLLEEGFLHSELLKKLPRGISLSLYNDFFQNPDYMKPWDILVLAAPDRNISGDKEKIDKIINLKARLRLGIFYNPPSPELSLLFVGKKNLDLKKYLIREPGDFLSLPRAHERLDTPLILDDTIQTLGEARFCIEKKFQKIQSLEFRMEQEFFHSEGKAGAFMAAEQNTVPDFRHMDDGERNSFFYWRGKFRKGTVRESCRAFLLLYARELILLMGGGPPEKSLEELMRLDESYGTEFPDIPFSRWILDFAVIHQCMSCYIPSPGASAGRADTQKDFIVHDLYLYKKYIEQNHSLEFFDFLPLLSEKIRHGEFRRSPWGGLLDEKAEASLNSIDLTLRKGWGKKLLEFFCPLPKKTETFTAFEGLGNMGNSSYTCQWLCFSNHKPLIEFLDSLCAFLEYRLQKERNFERPGNLPALDPLWKYLAGLDEEGGSFPPELGFPPMELEQERIHRLREESDQVMELLKIEESEDPVLRPRAKQPSPWTRKPHIRENPPNEGSVFPMEVFINSLDKTELRVLEIISAARTRNTELAKLAREGIMAELIIDRINEKFLEERGDLLIINSVLGEKSVDEGPEFSAEYRDEAIWALTFRNA